MALTGFDPQLVSTSINGVTSAYEDLIRALTTEMQNKFVDGMADKWACKDAQDFFTNKFKPAIDSLVKQTTTIFESVADAMNSAARNWAADTETEYSTVAFTPNNTQIDVGNIQENIGGTRGVDVESTPGVVASLSQITSSASAALEKATSAVQNCGFVGGSQEANLVSSLSSIKTNLESTTTEMTGAVKSAIDQTVAQYGDTKGKIEAAFTGK